MPRARALAAALTAAALVSLGLLHAPVPAHAGSATATPYFVQHVLDFSGSAGVNTAIPIPAGVATTSGDTLVISTVSTATGISGAYDSQENSYLMAASGSDGAVVASVAVSFDPSALDGDNGDTITLNWPNDAVANHVLAGSLLVSVDEYAAVEGIDQSGSTAATGTSASLSLTPNDAPEWFVGVVGTLSAGPPTLGAGWTSRSALSSAGSGTGEQAAAVSQLMSATSATTLSASGGPGTVWSLAGVTLYANGESVAADVATLNTGLCAHSGSATISHVVLIIDENHSSAQIIGNGKAPSINNLISQCGSADDYTAATHPSLPNYLALTGALPPTKGDCNPIGAMDPTPNVCTGLPFTSSNIFGKAATATSYLGNMDAPPNGSGTPANCEATDYQLTSTPQHEYAAHHNAQMYFSDSGVTASGPTAACTSNDVSLDDTSATRYTALTTATLSAFTVIVLDNTFDMHTGSIAAGDRELGSLVNALTGNVSYTDGSTLILFTFDEGQKINCPPGSTTCTPNHPVVAKDKPCYNPDSSAAGAFNSPTGPELMTAGTYTDASLIPQSCMVPLVAASYHMAHTVVHTALNHYDTLYTVLSLLGKTATGVLGIDSDGDTDDVDTWAASTHCGPTACHAPTDYSGSLGL